MLVEKVFKTIKGGKDVMLGVVRCTTHEGGGGDKVNSNTHGLRNTRGRRFKNGASIAYNFRNTQKKSLAV